MAQFEIYRDVSGEYRWRFKASNELILAVSSEGYKTTSGCQHAIGLLMKEASDAEIERMGDAGQQR
ncbi:MAG: DUF1508 domain-containing protein [bacterium]